MIFRSTLIFFTLMCIYVSSASAETPFKIHLDLSYASSTVDTDLQKLNLVLPKTAKNPPLLIWVGGGAWSYVDKDKEMDLAKKMAKGGVAVASIGHSLSPAIWQDPERSEGIQHPAHIKDIAAAVNWLIEHSDDYNFDTSQIYLGGFSSGAHLAALLVSDPKYLTAHDVSLKTIKGVIAIGGSYDMLDYHRAFRDSSRPHLAVEHVEAVFGSDKEIMKEASPIQYVGSFSTKMLLISDRDTYNYTKLYEDALISAEVAGLTVVHIGGLGHGPLWQHLSHSDDSPYRDMMLSFIKTGLPNKG